MVRHFLDIHQLDAADLRSILDDAHARKAARKGWPQGRPDADAPGKDRVLAMIFEKNSTRTRFSFDAAIRQLGGAAIIATASDMQLGRGETIADTARVLSRYADVIMIRTDDPAKLREMAAYATVPVINGLTDRSHPCQILADLQTIEEHSGPVSGKTIAWIGDGNNVCHSFMHAAPRFGFHLNVACPAAYHPDLRDLAKGGGAVTLTSDPREAVKGADVVVTDTWVSMGDQDYEARLAAFEDYTVDEALMGLADPDAVFLHCLPAHRGEEVTDAVIDGPRSLVWDEAENRIHAQKAVLAWCFAG